MPKKLPPKNSSWVQLTKDFVKEWPEILEGLHFTNMPVKYLLYCNINLKNHITIHYDIKKELERQGIKVSGKSNRLLKDIYLYSKVCNINIKHEK